MNAVRNGEQELKTLALLKPNEQTQVVKALSVFRPHPIIHTCWCGVESNHPIESVGTIARCPECNRRFAVPTPPVNGVPLFEMTDGISKSMGHRFHACGSLLHNYNQPAPPKDFCRLIQCGFCQRHLKVTANCQIQAFYCTACHHHIELRGHSSVASVVPVVPPYIIPRLTPKQKINNQLIKPILLMAIACSLGVLLFIGCKQFIK